MIKKYFEIRRNHPGIFSNQNSPFFIIDDQREIEKWEKIKKAELQKKKLPQKWADIGVILDDPYIMILRDLIQFPDGFRSGYIRMINQADLLECPSVVILPKFGANFILLYRYRHATRAWHYEVPRGFGQPNTAADGQARNEIREEIGAEIENIIDLGAIYNNTGIEGNRVQLFFANLKNLGKPQKEEGIEKTVEVSLQTLEKMIANEEITDGFTVAAYTRAKLRGLFK